MRKSNFNSSGSGPTPRLGSGKTRFQARPTTSKSGDGIHAGRGDSLKAARPGGATNAPKGARSETGSVARPGGSQEIKSGAKSSSDGLRYLK